MKLCERGSKLSKTTMEYLIALALPIVEFMLLGFLFGIYQQKMKFPEKSWIIAAFNALTYPLRLFRICPFHHGRLTIRSYYEDIQKELGLFDYGDLEFLKCYEKFERLRESKKLIPTNIGYITMSIDLKRQLRRRLEMIAYLKKHPEILDIKINAPIFVVGLGRSGTTFLHRLLSLDPHLRSPTFWEFLYPVPRLEKITDPNHIVPYDETLYEKDRAARCKELQDWLDLRWYVGDDGISAFHEVSAKEPEECLLAMSDEIPISIPYLYRAFASWKTFHREITSEHYIRALRWEKKILQTLAYQTNETCNERRWVLKCLLHIGYLKELGTVFPDAKLIWTHRDPGQSISSMCGLETSLHSVYFEPDSLDEHDLGKSLMERAKDLLGKGENDLNECGLPCCNVRFEELVSSPIKVVKEVYEYFGWYFSPEFEKILEKHLLESRLRREAQKNQKFSSIGKKTKGNFNSLHSCTLEQFGLSADQVKQEFQNYISRYLTSPLSTSSVLSSSTTTSSSSTSIGECKKSKIL